MTLRYPHLDPDELAVTHDESSPDTLDSPPVRAQGSGDREPIGVRRVTGRVPRVDLGEPDIVAAYFDEPRDSPRAPETVDLADRVAALEAALPSAAENAKWIRRGVKVGAGVVGLAGAILVYALAFARSSGDAAATAREREAQRVADHELLLVISQAVAEIRGELRARNPIGMVPLIGPPTKPQDPTP